MSENGGKAAFPILAFDFGGTRGRCCLGAPDGSYAQVVALERSRDDDGTFWLRRLIQAGREICIHTAGLKLVSVSFGGPVMPDGRVISMHVAGWEKVDLRRELSDAFGVPVCIENDGNSGAVGEHRYGAGRGAHFMIYMTVSTGIGGGVILGDHLYRGVHGMAGEFGHMVLHPGPNAPQFGFGKPGILEALASGSMIGQQGSIAREKMGSRVGKAQLFTEMEAKLGLLTGKDVFDAARRKEGWAIEVRDAAVRHLARGVAAAICAYDVELVVIGGGVAMAGDVLFVPLRKEVNNYLPAFLEGKVEVVQAALGDHGALLGAVASGSDYMQKHNLL
ncbi:MAG TPA: ROK family protein [Planctomycetota bacterium]|nr:ROK family protein [Planctomycetota bacterium]